MIAELETITLQDEYIRENESSYLIDYLYGISDLDLEVNSLLSELGLEDHWIVFYRCLIKSDILEKGQYDKLRKYKENLFLIRDELDLEEVKEFLGHQKIEKTENELNGLLEKIEEIAKEKNKTYDDLFCDNLIKKKFEELLESHISLDEKNNKDKWEKSIFDLDSFLMEKDVKAKIEFTKTEFMTKVLGLNNAKLAGIKKRVKEGAK